MSAARGRVLVVDDEPVNRELLESMLVPLGYDVRQAEDGRSGLRAARNDRPDVVLLDVMMPAMDGFEVVRALREDPETKGLPVVMVTSLHDVQDRVRALQAGASDFLTKPVDRAELQATVAAQMQIKAYHDHLKQYQETLEEEVRRRTDQLSQALTQIKATSLDTIYRLSMAAEYRDEDTGAHIKRISRSCAAIARRLGYDKEKIEAILYAAPMHDVGKIGIPDHILLKPGKLDPEEWEIMKSHTTIGGGILQSSDSSLIRLGQVIALTHHEKWNGTGYPHGLSGENIPLPGRIVAVADVYDALVSRRPYKGPLPVDRALEIIRSERGKHFDPEVIKAFFDALVEIRQIQETYADGLGGSGTGLSYLAAHAKPSRSTKGRAHAVLVHE